MLAVVGHNLELSLMLHHLQRNGAYHRAQLLRHHMHPVTGLLGIIQQVVVAYHLVGIILQLLLYPSVGLALERSRLHGQVQLLLLLFQPRPFGRERGIREKACTFIHRVIVGEVDVAQRMRLTRKSRHQLVRHFLIRKEPRLVAHHGRERVGVGTGSLREGYKHPPGTIRQPNIIVVVLRLEDTLASMLRRSPPTEVDALRKSEHTFHSRHRARYGLAETLLARHRHPCAQHTRHGV